MKTWAWICGIAAVILALAGFLTLGDRSVNLIYTAGTCAVFACALWVGYYVGRWLDLRR